MPTDWRGPCVAAALWALGILGAACATPGPLTVRTTPVSSRQAPLRTPMGQVQLLAALRLSTSPTSGGFSGLELDGDRLVMLSDRGFWIEARLDLDADGRLRGLQKPQRHALRDPQGRAVRAPLHDSEGITRAPDGDWLVSFEWQHRVWNYGKQLTSGHPRAVPLPTELSHAPSNKGLEAITVLPDGRLLLLCERYRTESGDHRGWLGRPGAMSRITLRPTEDFLPVDLATLPKTGDVVLLERSFGLLHGQRSRLSLIPKHQLQPQARLEPQELARLQSPIKVDNFEGLAVGHHPRAGTVLYLISDDNFSPLQDTLLYQLQLRLGQEDPR